MLIDDIRHIVRERAAGHKTRRYVGSHLASVKEKMLLFRDVGN
jgi:hypothetical protein